MRARAERRAWTRRLHGPAAGIGVVVAAFLAVLVPPDGAAQGDGLLLVDPEAPVSAAWEHRAFGAPTRYENVVVDGVPAIRATGRGTASGLYRRVFFRPCDRPVLSWRWRVERAQPSADLGVEEREDFAAALYLLFGRPGLLDREVRAIAYVWTGGAPAAGTVVDGPRHAGRIRKLVLRSGAAQLGRWVPEHRDLVADYRRLFGEGPPPAVETVALWSDSDQTGEAVEAYYGAVVASRDPGGPAAPDCAAAVPVD